MKNTDGKNHDSKNLWHHFGNFNWDNETRWWAQIAGDCVDLNTENPTTYNYLINCYSNFIKMGVDGFRIDTGGHISRLVFNKVFNPAFTAAAEKYKAARNGGPFFMFSEVCARYSGIWYREIPALSVPFYTWKESKEYAWNSDPKSWESMVVYEGDQYLTHPNQQSCLQHYRDNSESSKGNQPVSDNVFLKGNTYHKPDYSKYSGLSVIDFPMHHNFCNISGAWGIATGGDRYYNDASYNVVYVDSHDYAPNGAPEDTRFNQHIDTWAENLSLMFTFRGIPCLYYGSEIEFKKGCSIDKGPNMPLKDSGRAYFGGYIKGDINVTDFAEWSNATGNMNATLNYPLALHIQRLNKIRMAVPALRKGQYSTEGCQGQYAFKRRFTDDSTDSYVLVTISGGATFTGIENGEYTDAITGDKQTVTNGTLTANCSGRGNMRIYVLKTDKNSINGKIGNDGQWLYASSPVHTQQPGYDGTQEELTEEQGGGTTPPEVLDPYTPSLTDKEMTVFFEAPADGSYSNVSVWCWSNITKTNYTGGTWPGEKAVLMGTAANGNKIWKWTFSAGIPTDDMPTHIIFNSTPQPQTATFEFNNGGYYTSTGLQYVVAGAGGGITPPEEIETYTPSLTETEMAAFFEAPADGSYSNVSVWCWSNTTGTNYTGGTWPGEKAVLMGNAANGNKIWKWTYSNGIPTTDMPTHIIFNNTEKPQTADLEFKNGGYYNVNGLQYVVNVTSGIEAINKNEMKIYTANGEIIVYTEKATTIQIASIDGRFFTKKITPGINKIGGLARGIYIINGKKVIL